MSDYRDEHASTLIDVLGSPSSGMTRRSALGLALAGAAWPLGAGAQGAEAAWPTKPVTLILPFGPGGIADISARTVMQKVSESIGQQVNVDNRPGAGGVVAGTAVTRAEPDGHTLLLMSNGSAVSTVLFKSLPFDVMKDFAHISLFGTFDLVMVVGADSKVRTLADLQALAKSKSGGLTIATITRGSTQNLAAEWFKSVTQLPCVIVPYKGTPDVVQALRAGEADLGFEILGPVLSQVRGGNLRALAITSGQRFSGLGDVPTAAEFGIGGYQVSSWNGVAAPARTPAAVVRRIQMEVHKAIADPAVQAKLTGMGMRAQSSTPEQMADRLAGDIAHWGKVARAAGIEPQ